ncbi:type I-E CRISPR-associated protein Cas5/CasD [Kitasatospora sp. NPDC056138]|uniref:type I-E CRISPR-associated protein Cas5/CasD n=1 Tax=Kitasatospora sp. NPDC056138 TaxID=3345724 RepID=UPI0035DDAFC5
MTGGLILHLAGPLQAWGGPQGHGTYPTGTHPTRSALIGLLAACLGRAPDADNSDLDSLHFTIRVDRPGQRESDFHTIGGGYPPESTPPDATGRHRTKPGQGTLTTTRWYMTDAAFTIAVTGPTRTLHTLTDAIDHPHYPPYLGRRSCVPDVPLTAWPTPGDPVAELRRFPLHRARRPTGPVEFISDTPPRRGAPPDATLRNEPGPGRTFADYDLWHRHEVLPPDTPAGTGTAYLTSLTHYRETQS